MVYAICVESNQHNKDECETSQGLRVLGRLLARAHQLKTRSTATELNGTACNHGQFEQPLDEDPHGVSQSKSRRHAKRKEKAEDG